MKVLFLTLLLGLVCAAQEKEAEPSASAVSGMVWSRRRSWGCVCVSLLWFCYVDPWAACLPPPQYCSIHWLYTCSISCLYRLYCILIDACIFPSLVAQKEDQPNSCWRSCIWHQRFALSEMSPFLLLLWLQFLHYFINPALFSAVW